MSKTVEVRHNAAEKRYETTVEGHLALIDYKLKDNRIALTHTEVPSELEGQGIASQMAKFALNDAREKGYKVKPICPFIVGYIKRHPEYEDLVA